MSIAFMLLGISGALSVTAAAIALSPKVNAALADFDTPQTVYPSLLRQAAFAFLHNQSPDPLVIRANLQNLLVPARGPVGFVTQDDQIAMVLAQIMARWDQSDVLLLTDDQARELWLIERLLRATPAEAGALANCFAAPNAVLAMRDRIANTSAA